MGVQFCNLIGNTALKSRMSEEISNRTFSHAYIIEGKKGCGKHTLAMEIAAAVSCVSEDERPCRSCKNCKKLLSGSSPDLILFGLEDDKSTIGVDTVRRIRDDISTAPNDLDMKFYLIENADLMTLQAQNALLLSLEEPPEYVMFFLICESSGLLLETVRSRAPTLRLTRLSYCEVEEYLISNDKRAAQLRTDDEKTFKTIVHASDGCIGRGIELLDTKERKALLDERAAALKILSLLSTPNRAEILHLIPSVGSKRTEVLKSLNSVQHAVRDLILLKKTEAAHLLFFYDKEEACELSTHFTSASLISLYDALCTASKDLEANANVRLTLLNMIQNAGLI